MTSAQNVVLSGRSVDEITADIRVNYRNAKASIVAIGRDLAEVKQMLNHGEWLPYLQGLNISVSSAENYMRYAAEVPGNDQLAALPYSAAIALIALPEDEREQFMQDNDIEDKSAAEIKRLIAATKQEAENARKQKKRFRKRSLICIKRKLSCPLRNAGAMLTKNSLTRRRKNGVPRSAT